MLQPTTQPFRKRRGKERPPRPAPAPLTLVEAAYEPGGPWVQLRFDRAIDYSGLVGAEVIVDDGAISQMRWAATGAATAIDPQTVRIDLFDIGPSTVPDVRLFAGAGSGIVAADDGGAWAGAGDLALPFG